MAGIKEKYRLVFSYRVKIINPNRKKEVVWDKRKLQG